MAFSDELAESNADSLASTDVQPHLSAAASASKHSYEQKYEWNGNQQVFFCCDHKEQHCVSAAKDVDVYTTNYGCQNWQ